MSTFAMNISVPAHSSAIKQVAVNNRRLHEFGHTAHVNKRGDFRYDLGLITALVITTVSLLVAGEMWGAVLTTALAGASTFTTWADMWMLRRIPGLRVEGIAAIPAEQFSHDLAQAVKYLTVEEQDDFVRRGLEVAGSATGTEAAMQFRGLSRDIITRMPDGVRLSHI